MTALDLSLIDLGLIALGYLFGSLSAAIIICRLLGLPDPRSEGSNNPGATNVLRIGGKKAAAMTLIGDLVKGLIPIVIARTVTDDPVTLALVAMTAFLGHLYPLFFGFRGGKGVATAFGVLLGLAWPVALAVLGTWLLVAFISRISSLSALTAAALSPLFAWWLAPYPAFIIMMAAMVLLLIWRHRSNIRNILNGTEKRIGQKG